MTIKVLKQRKIYKVVFFYFSGDLEYKARHSGVNPNGKQTWMSGHSLLSGFNQPNYFNTDQTINTRGGKKHVINLEDVPLGLLL